jgi:sugar/nucleoside kinase (ribokinase family)
MPRILCIGDIMLDVTAILTRNLDIGVETRSQISTQGGGAAANVASWLATHGTSAYLIARVGDDAAGRVLLDELDHFGVEHSNRVIVGARTGVVMVLVDPLGERTMFPDSGANAGLSPADLPELKGFDAIYLSGYPLLNPLSRPGVLEIIALAKQAQLPIIFDPSTVGVLLEVGVGQVREWLQLMDVVILNEEEAQFLTGKANPIDSAADLLELTQTVVIKRGSNGALGQRRGQQLLQVPAFPATVINTTGAGDAFAAGFIEYWANPEKSNDLAGALTRGAELGAHCVALIGARPLVAPQ